MKCYTVPEIRRMTDVFFCFSVWGIFCPFIAPNNPDNQNFEKRKKTWRYYHFKQVYHKAQSYDV